MSVETGFDETNESGSGQSAEENEVTTVDTFSSELLDLNRRYQELRTWVLELDRNFNEFKVQARF